MKPALTLVMLSMLIGQAPASALDLLMHGSDAQATGGLGIVTSSGATSLLYNPAAVSNANSAEAFGELGFLSVKYSYTYPNYDSAVIKVNTPFIFTGATIPVTDWLSIGGTLFPVPGGGPGLTLKNIPTRQLSQDPALIDVLTENTSPLDYETAFGFAVTNRSWLSFGVSYLLQKQESRTTVNDSESGSEIFSMNTKIVSETGIFGLKVRPMEALRLGLTYQTLTKMTMNGNFLNDGGESFSGKAHKGRQIGAGAQVIIGAATGWGEILHRHHSENNGNLSPFAVGNPVTPESFAANSFAMGLGLKISPTKMITAGFGWHPTTAGSGYMSDDPLSDEEIPGIQFGDLDAISRKVLGAGYRQAVNGWLIKSSFSFQTGLREVDDIARGQGTYGLDVFTLTGSIGMRL